ncbi:hypothetical protein Thpro_020670 [Acidihalobacter prosperus]|uniref:Uncharacterized protein n=1 Tax=Acidihalobacter prosperus TaxID=160660 RepID=A0A1A6C8T1_9GAMM|nr:hypothetical protein Thpro_020670 [Acidihalobacter prosperus]
MTEPVIRAQGIGRPGNRPWQDQPKAYHHAKPPCPPTPICASVLHGCVL